MRLTALGAAATAAVVLAVSGCGGGGSNKGGTSLTVPPSTQPPPSPASGTIGPNGGSVVNAQGDEVDIPAGDITTSTVVSIGAAPSGIVDPGFTPVGPPVEFTPNGLQFKNPATVTVKFNPSQIPAGMTSSNIRVLRRDSTGTITPLVPTNVDTVNQKVSVLTGDFCTFEPEATANVTSGTLTPSIVSMTPLTGVIGTPVTILVNNLGTVVPTVTFNGIAATATVTLGSPAQVHVTVPTGATTGTVLVTVGTSVLNAGSFTVGIVTGTTSLQSITPSSGGAGMSVTLVGTNLAAVTNVALGTSLLTNLVATANQITGTTSVSMTAGPVDVIALAGTQVVATIPNRASPSRSPRSR